MPDFKNNSTEWNLFTVNLLLWLDYRYFEVRREYFPPLCISSGPSLESVFQHRVSHRVVHVISNTAVSSSETDIDIYIWTHIWKWRQRVQWLSNLLLMTQRVNGCGIYEEKPGSSVRNNCVPGHQLREVDAERLSQPLTQSHSGSRNTESMWESHERCFKRLKEVFGLQPTKSLS